MSIAKYLRRGAIVAGVVATVAAGAGVAVAANPGQTGDGLQSKLDQLRSEDNLPGVIGLVRDGDSNEYGASGWGDQFMRVPADPRAQFRIGSNTKAFVAVVLLQLEAEGKLSLDDTVDKWLPGAVSANGNDGTKITIRELLNMTSGLNDYLADPTIRASYIADLNPGKQWDPQHLVDVATSKKPSAQPGTEWNYSNTNFIVAGMIIKAVTGNDAATEVENRIIKPLGLADTTFPTTDPKLYGNWLHGYYHLRDISFSNVTVTGAAGAMVSTLDDLATFERALYSGQLLPSAQQKELETMVPIDDNTSYGLGIGQAKTTCGTVWTYTGEVLGYIAEIVIGPDGGRAVVIAVNEGNLGTGDPTDDLWTTGVDAYCDSDS